MAVANHALDFLTPTGNLICGAGFIFVTTDVKNTNGSMQFLVLTNDHKAIFQETDFNFERVVTHMRQQAYLVKGLRISVIDARDLSITRLIAIPAGQAVPRAGWRLLHCDGQWFDLGG